MKFSTVLTVFSTPNKPECVSLSSLPELANGT